MTAADYPSRAKLQMERCARRPRQSWRGFSLTFERLLPMLKLSVKLVQLSAEKAAGDGALTLPNGK
jgi:hypothetical protein